MLVYACICQLPLPPMTNRRAEKVYDIELDATVWVRVLSLLASCEDEADEDVEDLFEHQQKQHLKQRAFVDLKFLTGGEEFRALAGAKHATADEGAADSDSEGVSVPDEGKSIFSDGISLTSEDVRNRDSSQRSGSVSRVSLAITTLAVPDIVADALAKFNINASRIFEGAWAQKKFAGDIVYRKRFLWVDPHTRRLYWGKTQRDKELNTGKCIHIPVSVLSKVWF